VINELELRQQSSELLQKSLVFTAIASLAIAVICLSLAAIFIKLSEQEISPNALVFHRLWMATTIFGLWNQLSTKKEQNSDNQPVEQKNYASRTIALLLVSGVCSSAAQYSLVWSLTQTGAANATLLRNFTPIFTILGAWLLFGQQFDRRFLLGAVLVVGGGITIGLNDWHIASNSLQGDALAILSAVFYSGSMLIVERLRAELNTITIMLWRCAVGAVVTLPIMLISAERIFPSSILGWSSVIAFAVVCQVMGQGLLAYCLKHLSSGFVGIALLLEPVITTCLAWALFSEHLSRSNGVTFVVVLAGIYLAISSSSSVKE
jgi:drug/metabolite transporter (DMT)-like permease